MPQPPNPYQIASDPVQTSGRIFSATVSMRREVRPRFASEFRVEEDREFEIVFGHALFYIEDGNPNLSDINDLMARTRSRYGFSGFDYIDAFATALGPLSPAGCIARVWAVPFYAYNRTIIVGNDFSQAPDGLRVAIRDWPDPSYSVFAPPYGPAGLYVPCGEQKIYSAGGSFRGTTNYELNAGPTGGTAEYVEDLDPVWLRSIRETVTISISQIETAASLGPEWDGPTINLCPAPGGDSGIIDAGEPTIGVQPGGGQVTDPNNAAIESAQLNDPLRTCRGCGG